MIGRALKELWVSRAELADLLGVESQELAEWERNDSPLPERAEADLKALLADRHLFNLRKLRRQLGVSRRDLAALLGVSRLDLHGWLRGRDPIPPSLPGRMETLRNQKFAIRQVGAAEDRSKMDLGRKGRRSIGLLRIGHWEIYIALGTIVIGLASGLVVPTVIWVGIYLALVAHRAIPRCSTCGALLPLWRSSCLKCRVLTLD